MTAPLTEGEWERRQREKHFRETADDDPKIAEETFGVAEPYTAREEEVGGAPPSRAPVVNFTAADELLAESPSEPEWVWEHGLAKGAVTLFAKKPKAGGSTFTYELVKAVANHEPAFLGRDLQGGPVVFASEEGHATLGATFPRLPEVYLATRESAWPKPAWRDLVTSAAVKVREVNAVLCVIDTFSFWNGLAEGAEKDSGAVQPLLDALIEITQTGCAVWLAHHHRKSGGEDGDALRGTTAIAGGVDCFAELEKIENAPANHRRLVITPRWASPPVLVLDYGLHYRVIGQAADRDESGEIGWEGRLLEAVPENGDGITLDELAETLGADRRKWHKTFTALMADGHIERTGKGNRYDPYRHLLAAVPSSRPASGTDEDGRPSSAQPSSRIYTDGCAGMPTALQVSNGTARTDEPDSSLGDAVEDVSQIEYGEALAAGFEGTA
jgi:hypothetical protein